MSLEALALTLSLLANAGMAIVLWHMVRTARTRIAELASSRHETAESSERILIALEGAELGVWEWDVATDRFSVSDRFLAMLGMEHGEIDATHSSWEALVHPEDLPVKSSRMRAYLNDPVGRYECEYRIRHKSGNWVWVMDRGRLLGGSDGRRALMVGTLLDISSRKDMEQRLLLMATTDPLTSLPNRRTFEERLRREWLHIKRNPGQKTVVAICDIDHFKKINDTHGHQCGDEVLKHFSSALAQNIRGNDLAARIGGEEFAILLQDTSIVDAQAWADRFGKTIAESTLSYNNTALTYTASIGLAHLEGGLDSPDEAVKRADEALYRAKNNGRNQVVFASMENDDERKAAQSA